jgi:hypothetical protein
MEQIFYLIISDHRILQWYNYIIWAYIGETRNAHRILVGKPIEKQTVVNMRRCKDNIMIDRRAMVMRMGNGLNCHQNGDG